MYISVLFDFKREVKGISQCPKDWSPQQRWICKRKYNSIFKYNYKFIHKKYLKYISSILYTSFFSLSPYFRGWHSVRENYITAKSANSGKLRKANYPSLRRRLTKLVSVSQCFIPVGVGHMHTVHTLSLIRDRLTAVCLKYFIEM